MKELLSIIFATSENVSLKERIVYGLIYPAALLCYIMLAAAMFN